MITMDIRKRHIVRTLRAAVLLLFVSAFLSRCASMMTPTGGPRDSLPPVIVNMTPDNFSTNRPLVNHEKIYIEFDEFVQLKDQQKEFFTSPQKYLLGTDGDPFEQKTKWEAYIGNIFNIDMNDDGSVPQFGQLSQGSMQPHTDYMRALAMRFSGETNVPVSQLGVIHDNPSSAEAIYAANEPLIIEAQTLIDDNSDAMVLVAQMALATYRGVALSELAEEELDILPHFKSPAMPSVVSQADAMVKIAAVVPKFPGTSVFWEMLGFSEDMRNRTKSEMEAGDNREALIAIMGGGQAGADESPRG